ncbi:MAG: NmrA/HSCARG family protein, partial [Aquincola sp.]|nr:NmrA/HSCARG family protein [Aquincola sp.]
FTGAAAAAVWSEQLGRPVHYGGDDVEAFERQLLSQQVPAWMAYDLRLMMARIQQVGQRPAPGAVERLEQILGRPLRSYQAFVAERVRPA